VNHSLREACRSRPVDARGMEYAMTKSVVPVSHSRPFLSVLALHPPGQGHCGNGMVVSLASAVGPGVTASFGVPDPIAFPDRHDLGEQSIMTAARARSRSGM
jgi:hypothetical protein